MSSKQPHFSNISKIQTLPSGLMIEIGEWTVGDIASMGQRGSQGGMNQLIGRCTVYEDPHQIYGMSSGSKLDAAKLQTGDRAVVILLQRIYTHWRACGPDFHFSFQCQDLDCHDANPKPIPWAVDLRRFLLSKEDIEADRLQSSDDPKEFASIPVYTPNGLSLIWADRFGEKPIIMGDAENIDKTIFLQTMSQEAQECWKNGNRFEYDDPYSGNKLWWKIMTGTDEDVLQRFRKAPDKFRLHALDRRIVEVDGIPSFQKMTWISQWSAGAEDLLQDHINKIEPGLFKEFDVRCPRCGLIQEVSFPLDLSFFSPSTRKRKHGNI